MVPCMFLLYTYPEDPASANNANIRQRARKPMTLVRFLKCHQIWPTFISSDFMVDCASDNTTKSSSQLLITFSTLSVPNVRVNNPQHPSHHHPQLKRRSWELAPCAKASAIYLAHRDSSPTKKGLPELFPIDQDSMGSPC